MVLLGSVVVAWPLDTRAQQAARVYRLSIVFPSLGAAQMTEAGGHTFFRAFFEELRRLGYEEGRNLKIDRWSADGRPERQADLAREAARSNPDVLFTPSSSIALDLKAATNSIPVVALTIDPVALGLAASLGRPGGNITGLSMQVELAGKYLDLLKTLNPQTAKVGALHGNPNWDQDPFVKKLKEVAAQLEITVVPYFLQSPIDETECRRVIPALAREQLDAVLVGGTVPYVHRALVVELLAKTRLPAIYQLSDYVKLGGLMAYAINVDDLYRRSAQYIDKIFKGATPAEMPFYENTRYSLVINLKTAKALGLTIRESLLARADEVIE